MRQTLRRSGSNVSFFAFQDIITSVIGILIFISLLLALFISSAPLIEPTAAPRQEASPEELQSLEDLLRQIGVLESEIHSAKLFPTAVTEGEIRALENELQNIQSQLHQIPSSSTRSEPAPVSEISENIEAMQSQLATIQSKNAILAEEVRQAQSDVDALQDKLEEKLQAKIRLSGQQNDLFLIPERDNTTKSPVLLDVKLGSVSLQSMDGRQSQTHDLTPAGIDDLIKGFSPTEYFIVAFFRPKSFQVFKNLIPHLRERGFELGYDVVKEEQSLFLGTNTPEITP